MKSTTVFGSSWISKVLGLCVIMSFSFHFSAQALDKKDNVQGSHNKYNNSLCLYFL